MQRVAASELAALLLMVDAGYSSALWQEAVAAHHRDCTALHALCCAAWKAECNAQQGAKRSRQLLPPTSNFLKSSRSWLTFS